MSFTGFVGGYCCELFVEIRGNVVRLVGFFVVEGNCSVWLTVGFV